MLTLIRDTENDELASALQKFVCQFSNDITPLAVEVTKHLVSSIRLLKTFNVEFDQHSKSFTAYGLG